MSPYTQVDLAVLSFATSPEYKFASELLRRDRNVEKRMNAGIMTVLNFIAYFFDDVYLLIAAAFIADVQKYLIQVN